MQIEIKVSVDQEIKTYTVYKEELERIVCSKAREDNPKAESVLCFGATIDIKV